MKSIMTSTLTKGQSNSLLAVAQVLKPQGVNGEIKVLPLLDKPEDICAVKNFYLSNNTATPHSLTTASIRLGGGFAFLKLKDIDGRNKAEALRGKLLYANREELPKLEEGRHYIVDLIGCEVCEVKAEKDKSIGVLKDILQHGAADVYVLEGMQFPAIKEVIACVDIENKKIYVDGEKLKEVAVYD